MTLPVPYPVYGVITDGGSPVNNALVHAQDTTTGGTIATTTTNANGEYQINLENIANDGNNITVWSSYDGKNKNYSFTLNIANKAERVNLALESTTLSDSVSLSESLSKIADMIRSNTDSITLSDSYNSIGNFNSVNSDSLTFSDVLSKTGSFNRSNSDTITINDTITPSGIFERTSSDTITLSDVLSKTASFIFSETDTLT